MRRKRDKRNAGERGSGAQIRLISERAGHTPTTRDLRKEVLRSGLIFLLVLLASYSFLVTEWGQRNIMIPANEMTARTAALLIKAFDHIVVVDGAVLKSTWFSVEVKEGCNGIHAIIIPLAGVIAFPTTWRNRAIGVLIILLCLSSINTIRVVTLVFVLAKYPSIFGELHDYLWQFAVIIIGALMWLLWYGKVVIRSNRSAST